MDLMNNHRNKLIICLVFLFIAASIFLPVLLTPGVNTCAVESGKTGNMVIVYSALALLSVLILLGYLLLEKKKEIYFAALFACVTAINGGYFLQAISHTRTAALMANRLSYLGAAYSVLVILLIIMDVCRIRRTRWLTTLLVGISTAAFLLAASGDWLGLYYEAVSIETVNGMTRLVKDYGPLHILYPVYLLSYFVTMVAVIIRAGRKGTLSSPKYAVFLTAVALTNLIVWGVEQVIDVDFEFLSVSYIATEVMLLAIYSMLRDYGIVQPGGTMASVAMLTRLNTSYVSAPLPPNMEEMFRSFAEKVQTLSTAERRILDYYIDGHEIADIPELAFISIHTVKKHNRSIYQKLDVSSRDALMLYIELFRCCGRLDELTGSIVETE